jgi:hypothetical protein
MTVPAGRSTLNREFKMKRIGLRGNDVAALF